jgi:hypothetical protein
MPVNNPTQSPGGALLGMKNNGAGSIMVFDFSTCDLSSFKGLH